MSRRGENIHKRKDNRWEGRYIAGHLASGKAKYVSVYAKTYSEVKKKLVKAQNQTRNALPTTQEKISFREVLFLWLDARKTNYKKQTYSRYRYIIETHIIPIFGTMHPEKITTQHINDFITMKRINGRLDGKGGLSASYIQTISFILLSALNYAAQKRYCPPFIERITKPPKTKKHLQVLTRHEQQLLEDYLLATLDSRKAGILLTLYTGVRLGELCGLKWEDVDFNNGTLHICQTVERIEDYDRQASDPKTRLIISEAKTLSSNRLIPLSQKTLALLARLKQNNAAFILPGLHNEYMDPRTLQYSFKQYLKACQLRTVKFHTLRHTFATRCMESGMDIKTLSELLGHANATITMNIYIHSTMEHKKEKMEYLSFYCGQK